MASHHAQHSVPKSASSTGEQSRRNSNQVGQSTSALADVKETTQRAGADIKDSTRSAAEGLRQQGESFFAQQTGKAASSLSSLSSAVRDAAEKLRAEDNDQAAQYAQMAADRLEGAAHFISKQNVGSLLSEVERAARRRPELFLGGMLLLGLGVSRFLKASSQSSSDRDWPS